MVSLLGSALGVGACSAGETGTDQTTGAGGASEGGAEPEGGSDGGMEIDPCDGVTCDTGEICQEGMCVPGCNENEDCAAGSVCCNGGCADLNSDVLHCGMCDNACPVPANQGMTCQMGICTLGACDNGFYDCDGDSANGCESSDTCDCTPGETQPCYPGPAGTENNAPCTAGTRKCNAAGTAWSLCTGFVLPSPEVCANNTDEDCNGVDDDIPDLDGDGWTRCDNDCCETTPVDCDGDPAKVNPGAFEFIGNSLDDDCDPATSDTTAPAACSTAADFNGVTPEQLAGAMELCQTTTANPPLSQRKWGLVSAEFRLASGASPSAGQLGNMQNLQTAVLTDYGNGTPQAGNTMAGLSTGRMRDSGDPGWVNPSGTCQACSLTSCCLGPPYSCCSGGVNPGTAFSDFNAPPGAYLAQHAGAYPASQSCNGVCDAGAGAYDSVNLRLEVRVPTNALSMSYKFRYFTAEYWSWACSPYNDFFLALLTTGAAGIPPDKNISFDSLNNPVSVNNGFFDVCQGNGSCYTCPSGFGALTNTGMDQIDPWATTGGGRTGGATVWLETTAPIVPGETITFELMVFDVSDTFLDSLVLLDDFQWDIDPASVGTGPPG